MNIKLVRKCSSNVLLNCLYKNISFLQNITILRRSFVSNTFQRSSIHCGITQLSCLLNASGISRHFSKVQSGKVPSMGDSITEGILSCWNKKLGDHVKQDEVIAVIDTDKISVDINCIATGKLSSVHVSEGGTVFVGDDLYTIELEQNDSPKNNGRPEATSNDKSLRVLPSISKEKVKEEANQDVSQGEEKDTGQKQNLNISSCSNHTTSTLKIVESQKDIVDRKWERKETIVPMSRLRKKIAQRLKTAQNTAASLTTFNECDMSSIISMRSELQDIFVKKYGFKLGFVSCFLLAASKALMKMPELNAYIDLKEENIIYKNYVDISVAVSTPTGLLVPVIRNCEQKSLSALENSLQHYATKAREGKITLEDMSGGSFTISNGGSFGSLLGTPIINPPQTSILGLHSIKKRPIVHNNQICIRPMMYLALTYDHRLVDGREAVTFLNLIKETVEDCRLLLLDI
ncbi:dihydrolipoyllysine-residue succinyltransferase component of 2-oxoglutarate dehydrogenase complex-like isoform X2 [Hylaeus volcanicus]|uniref:dihydrolipoyllysine-residue succinyltransferase component of 2-oxoglutarate dehydrogenase complex-like isoform X2 n=1 Tax=Hylaeus volcanicus TaxID=313075 RepID=UPI0023B7DEEC|nr:dihydrolipoyllysine-residue succinyltransferase component of 2-oxoglutarate dehydrogenase complex-like isoform X2 [Hylaeus volcanicus]